MDAEQLAEAAGEQTAAIVEGAIEQAEIREEAAAEIVEQVTEAARQSEIVRTVEDRLGEFDAWRGDVESRLLENMSSLETLRGQVTETLALIALLQAAKEAPPEPTLEPTPPPPSNLPSDAADGPRESPVESEPEPRKPPSRPRRKFW